AVDGAAADAGAGPFAALDSIARRTSISWMRPRGPVAWTSRKSSACWAASRRATGELLMRPMVVCGGEAAVPDAADGAARESWAVDAPAAPAVAGAARSVSSQPTR